MNKIRTIIMAATVALLIAAVVAVALFVKSTVFGAAEALKRMGEMPLATEQAEEKWVAPAMPAGDAFDLERGIDSTAPDGDTSDAREPDVDEEDLASVPVEETADELAGAAASGAADGT